MKTFEQCCNEVAKKHFPNGNWEKEGVEKITEYFHFEAWQEAAELYREEGIKEKEDEWKWKFEKYQEEIGNLNSMLSYFEEGVAGIKVKEALEKAKTMRTVFDEKIKEAIKLARTNNTCCQRVLGVVLEENDAICCQNYIGYTEQEILEKLKH